MRTDDSESEPWHHEASPKNNEACGKPLAGGSAGIVSSDIQKNQSNKGATMKHSLAISPDHVPHMNDGYNTVRKVHSRPESDPMKDMDVNMATWGYLWNATLRAAIHHGNDHDVKLKNVQNSSWRTTGQLFGDIESWSVVEQRLLVETWLTPRSKVDIHEFVTQSSSSIRHCQRLRLFRLGAVSGKNGRRSQSILEEQD